MQALNSHWLKWSAMDLSPVSVHFEFLLWCFSPDWHNSASSGLLCSARAVEGSFQVNVPHKGPEIGRLLHWRHKRISYQSRSQAPKNNHQRSSEQKIKTTKRLILSRFWERNIIWLNLQICYSTQKRTDKYFFIRNKLDEQQLQVAAEVSVLWQLSFLQLVYCS